MVASIYKISNRLNSKVYIGFTNEDNPFNRWKLHQYQVGKTNCIIHKAVQKYGIENFQFQVIYQSQDKFHTYYFMEEYFIKLYNSHYIDGYGYNMSYGGDGNLNYKWTPERYKQQSGQNHWNFNKHHSTETKEKISISNKGKQPWNPKGSKRLDISGNKHSNFGLKGDLSKTAKTCKFTKDNGEIIIFKGIKNFAEAYGYIASNLHGILKGKRKRHKDIVKVEYVINISYD